MPTTNSLITDAELLLSQGGNPLTDSALDAVTAQPWVDTDERFLQAKKALLATSPSPILELTLAEEGTELNDYQLNAVTVQPWVNKDVLMQETRTRALAALKNVA